MLRKTKHQYYLGLAALGMLVLASQSFAGTRVYVSYSSGRVVESCAPASVVYVERPVVVYPEPRCYDSSSFSISVGYSDGGHHGGHHYYRPSYHHGRRYYYNPPYSHRYDHRRGHYGGGRRW